MENPYYKAIFLSQRKEGMSQEEFRKYVMDVHVPLVAKMPGVRRYVQNFVMYDPQGEALPYDCVTELWFDSAEAMAAAYESPEGEAALADAPLCIQKEHLVTLPVAEEIVPIQVEA